MMSVKGGTQTWSTAPQTSSLKGSQDNSLPATADQKDEGKSVGDIANQIADPNWIDPKKAPRRVGGSELDKDAFLKLMLTQMKNQDPTNPLKSHEMAAQLAQFTSLEQLFNINETLGAMKKGQDPNGNFQALQLIGKAVAGDSSKVVRAKGDKEHEFNFTLPTAATELSVKVRNSTGDIVRTYDLKNLKAGEQKITWNGMTQQGEVARPGDYSFVVEGKASNGQKIVPKTEFSGRITGLNYTPQGPVLLIGNQTVRLSDVKKIVDPSLNPGTENRQASALDLSKENKKVETQKKIAEKNVNKTPAQQDIESNLDNIVMSGALSDKLKKETKTGG